MTMNVIEQKKNVDAWYYDVKGEGSELNQLNDP